MGYIDIVNKAADSSMRERIQEVQNTDAYIEKNGATVITDCRHDSTSNAYHSTVAMISYETHHVVAVQTVTKEEFHSSQTHEFEAIRKILPAVQAKGLNVVEVAHDFVPKIKNWLLAQNIQNSFDTWHGTKGVAKAMKEISSGAQKWEGERWFAELSDKQASVKRHFYFSMKNCTSPDDLKKRLLTVLDHYQANHNSCDPESKCKIPGYHCSKVNLTNPRAIAALRKFILDSKVYKLAEDYYQAINHVFFSYSIRLKKGERFFKVGGGICNN
ncbi:uncharacterized protein [Montipora capricornis]|uniref:uncharacterized protein n=1 Tax=Montipora capricornis TaxID=246305 RepID=UPI0035F213F7